MTWTGRDELVLKRIADALEKQIEQNDKILARWDENHRISLENLAISKRHLEMAEERRAVELAAIELNALAAKSDEITGLLKSMMPEANEDPK